MQAFVFRWICLLIVKLGFARPNVLSQPTTETGNYLNVTCEDFTNVLNFTIDGTRCKVFINNSNDVNCEGSTQFSQVAECEAPVTTIIEVRPQVSLFSGGTRLTIRGTHIDTLHLNEFTLDGTDNNTLENCMIVSTNEISCRTPAVRNWMNMKSIDHSISVSPRHCVTAPQFTVVFQTDPNFFLLDTREDVSIKNNILVLYAESLPEELQDDIMVEIGGFVCSVLEVTSHFVSCNASTIMEFSKRHFVAPSQDTNTNDNTATNKPIQQYTNNVSTTTKRTLLKPGKSAKGNTSTDPQTHNEQYADPIVTSATDTYVAYNVSVTIGNFRANLGVLKVYKQLRYDVTRKELVIALVICSVLLVLSVALVLLFLLIKRKKTQVKQNFEEGKVQTLEEILRGLVTETKEDIMDKFILHSNDVSLGDLIGSGNFGCVYEGILTKDQLFVKVAVKTLQDKNSENLDFKSFILEAVVMKDFQHPNVLQLLGLVEKETGIPYVILPYMDNGDLLTYVRRESVSLSLHDVIKFGADIASGMAYLSSLKFVHRDLAARNCMLDSSYTVKVADFGLCRDIYEKGYYSSDNKKMLPIRWMAIESIEHGSYSTKSDVWSLGVVLWEMLTRGLTPYPGVDGWDIINYLHHRRLSLPFFCPEELYYLMMLCWAKNPQTRPDFTTVQTELLRMIGQVSTQSSEQQHRVSGADPDLRNSAVQQNETSLGDEETNAAALNSTCLNSANQKPPEPATLEMEPSEHKCHTTSEEDAIKLKEQPNANEDPKRFQNQYVLLLSLMNAETTKNVDITIPECYSDKQVSKSAAGVYIQLVDQYEKLPNYKRTDTAVSEVSGGVTSDKITESQVVEDESFNRILSSNYFILEPSVRSGLSCEVDH